MSLSAGVGGSPPGHQPPPNPPHPGDHDLLASLASIRSALATGKLQQHDVLRMLSDLSLGEPAGDPTPTESGSGTSAAMQGNTTAADEDGARASGSKSTSPGLEHMQQGMLEQQLSGASLQSGTTTLNPASAAMINRLWHTSSAPVVAGGMHTTLMVCFVCVLLTTMYDVV